MKEFDTIAAIATSIGESGIAIIRVSGARALHIVGKVFQGMASFGLDNMKSHTLRYGYIVDTATGDKIDEVIVTYMKAPKSFTTEDTVEVNCHGGVISTKKVLEEILKSGARLAEPGEFTKRAFLNGRIDLSQAEAVIDIIRAKTDLGLKSAFMQSEGRLSKEITVLRNKILQIIAHIEATVDFPEDDLEEATSKQVLIVIEELINYINSLIKSAGHGKIIREGLSTVIIGKPNVGKSSLLNALLMENRAIVTDIPGTTRDIIEEYINIGGIPVKIVDTAGIRETEDLVEKLGVERSRSKIDEADLVILMLDGSEPLSEEDRSIIDYIKDKKYIVLINKEDLAQRLEEEDLIKLNTRFIFKISAKEARGMEYIEESIMELFFSGEITNSDIMITNTRHLEALYRAFESCGAARNTLLNTLAIDLASIDLRNAWKSLGEITGDTLEEDIVDKIFSEFCIGK